MSEGGSFGVNLAEKFFGLILVVIGTLTVYYTFTFTQALGSFAGFFGFLSAILLVIGLLLITAKTEE